jgi:hypothetical protein
MAVNADNLNVRYGLDKVKDAKVGVPSMQGGVDHWVVCEIVGTDLALGGGLIGGYPNTFIPAGAYIKEAIFIPTVAFVGSGATLDLGLANKDGTYTNLDEDGIDAAIATTAIDAIAEKVTCDGALVGTILTTGGYPSYDLDTALYTAGKGYLIITYQMTTFVT